MRTAKSFLLQGVLSACVTLAPGAWADQYCETVPPYTYRLIGCNLSVASISFPGNQLFNWIPGSHTGAYVFDPDDLVWTPTYPPPMPRGVGTFMRLATTNQFCFDQPTNAPVLPLNLASGYAVSASCQSNIVATFEDIVGRAPLNGTAFYKFMGGFPAEMNAPVWNTANRYVSTPEWLVYIYTNGVWSPSVPTAAIGEGVYIYQPAPFVYQPAALNPRISNDKFTFELETVYGKPVTIEYTETMPATSWQELTSFTGTGHRRTVIDDTGVDGNASRFYRIRTTQ